MDEHLLGDAAAAIPVDRVIPSFLPPTEPGTPDEALLARLPAEPFLLFVGALLPQKGIWPLLRAYGRLRAPALYSFASSVVCWGLARGGISVVGATVRSLVGWHLTKCEPSNQQDERWHQRRKCRRAPSPQQNDRAGEQI